MKRWKLYFKTDHLPPHLRAISEPFGALAAHIDATGVVTVELIDECLSVLLGAVDDDEAQEARDCMLAVAKAATWRNPAMRHLVRAKDAAVRAHIPDPVTL